MTSSLLVVSELPTNCVTEFASSFPSVYQTDNLVNPGGTAGCVIASRLASSAKKPRVLLLEAGGPNTGLKHRAAGERMMYWMFAEQNYRQKTDPEPVLGNRELLYYRSRGLGGTTVINLGVWDYGRREEYEKWARIVGDDVWSWDSAVAKMKKIESFHDKTPQDLREYVPDHKQNHGSDGPLDVSYPATWGPGLKLVLEGAKRQRFRLADLYSGDLGMGVPAVTAYNGLRTTASTAYLSDPPSNLHILTDTVVTRVMFEGNRAIGVQLADGTKCTFSSTGGQRLPERT
jgi:choline dehydrogenase-like flavoprotein